MAQPRSKGMGTLSSRTQLLCRMAQLYYHLTWLKFLNKIRTQQRYAAPTSFLHNNRFLTNLFSPNLSFQIKFICYI